MRHQPNRRKVCTVCGREKHHNSFRRSSERGGRLAAVCIQCTGGTGHVRTGRIHLTAEELASVVLPTAKEARAVQEAARQIRADAARRGQVANRAGPRGDDAIRAVTKDERRWCALASLAIAYARSEGAIYT